MHVLLVYQYYHTPDCPATGRHYRFVSHLGHRHRVTVLTSDEWYRRRQSEDFPWEPPGVSVEMVRATYDNRMPVLRRALAYGSFAARALQRGRRVDPPDVIWGSSTPLSAAWAAYRLARRLGRPWVFEVRDLWPEFPIQMGAVRSPVIQRALRSLERRMYASAARVVTLSEDMERHVLASGVSPDRVDTIVNGTDFDMIDAVTQADLARLRDKHALGDRRVVLYAGTLGRANGIPELLDAGRRLSDRTDMVIVIAGDGYYRDAVQTLSGEQAGVMFLPPQPRPSILAWFKLADIALVNFIDLPVLAANSPAKFFDSLGAGTPVVVTNPGWTRRFVERHHCGWYVPAGDATALASLLASLLDAPERIEEAGRLGEEVARRQFDRRHLAPAMQRILEEAADTGA